MLFFADTTVNIEPDAETLAEIAMLAAGFVRRLGLEPRVAMLSFSNFGSAPHPRAEQGAPRRRSWCAARPGPRGRRRDAGRHRAWWTTCGASCTRSARCAAAANVLIFPDLNAANIAYKLLARAGRRRGDSARSCWG